MANEPQKGVWLSGSEHFSALAQECQRVLEAIGMRVASRQGIKLGENAAAKTEEEIVGAVGIIILLGPKWSTTTYPNEGAAIEAQSSRGGSLWIVDSAVAIDPPAFLNLLDPRRQTRRLPRSGNALTQMSVQKRRIVLEELARSVAAQLGLPLPRDAQYRQLQEYRRTRHGQLEIVPLRGFFGAQHVDTARAFRFADLFVSPRLEWLREPASIAEQYRRLTAQIENDKLPSRERWAFVEQRHELVARYALGSVQQLGGILGRFPQIMLLGKPGSGKSTILHSLEMQAHQRDSELAVQIKLQSIAEKAGIGESLWPQVIQKIRVEHGGAIADAFEEWADRGRALLLLDGVDEVQKEHRAKLLSAVERMLLGRPKLRCVVTSRLANDCWLSTQIPHLQVADLSQEEIASFVRKHKLCEDPAKAEVRAEHMLKALAARSELGRLAHNPLSLRLLCLLDRGSEGMPRELVNLYERAIHTLLETWPANRIARKVRVSAAGLRQALASTAAWMHARGRREADRIDLLQQLAKALPSTKAKTAEQLAAYCLDVATEHSGILVEASPDKFEFLHLTFTEYLAADHYIRKNELDALAAQRCDSRYSQVICFAAGILAHVQRREDAAAGLLRCLIAEPPGTIDKLQHPHLPLAASCLGDGNAFPLDLVDDLLCGLLRAATVPLRSLTESVERTLDALRVPASTRIIAACAPLLHHPLDSLRLAVARFLAGNTIGRPEAQVLCLELSADWNDAIACHAALGLIRAGIFPEEQRILITVRLSYSFASKIAAAEEVEQALRSIPRLSQVAEELYGVENPRFQVEAARLLSLLRPDDWELLRLLLEKAREEDKLAVARAALRSESNAERIVDIFLEKVRPATIPRPSSESVLQSIFADSAAVRRRFLFHYRRPLPESTGLPWKDGPERPYTEAAAKFLQDVAGSGDEKKRSREARLHDLRALLFEADADLCRRIATLGAAINAPSDWLTDAIGRCMQAGGAYRVWAIDFAFQHKLYDLAVAGAMARAEVSDCLAATVQDIRRRIERHGGNNQPIVLALERQPLGSLRDSLLLLCRVNSGQEATEKIHPLLEGAPAAVPMVLCWWAAGETMFWARRRDVKPPVQLSGAILALAVTTWPDPPDLQMGVAEGRRPPSWVPKHHSHLDTMLWAEDGELPLPTGSSHEAAETVRTTLRWLYKVVEEGAELSWHFTDSRVRWFRNTVSADVSLFDDIIQGLADPRRAIYKISVGFLRMLRQSDRELTSETGKRGSTPPDQRTLIQQRLLHALSDAPPVLRWRIIELLDGSAADRAPILTALVTFLSAEHALSCRWSALLRLKQSEVTSLEEARAVLDAALAAEDLDLRLSAVDLVIERAMLDLSCIDALRPLLAPSARPTLRLQAAAQWLRLPNADRGVVLPVLTDLLVSLDPTGHAAYYRASYALGHLIGPRPESEPQHSEDKRLNPYNEKTGVGYWAAALLVELGGHEDALRSAAIAWLLASSAKTDDREPQGEERELALRLLLRIGVGSAGAAVDRVLTNMLVEEGDHPHQSFYWIAQFNRISRPMLDHLLPMMLRAHYNTDKQIADWVMALVDQDRMVRRDLDAALVSAIRDPKSPTRYHATRLLHLLSKFALIDDEAAELYVERAARGSLRTFETDTWFSDLVNHPIVRKHMLAALASHAPHDCLNLVDWLVPFSSLVPEDGSPVPPLADDVVQVLRVWLTHADYGLRIDAGERLYRCGHRDEAVMTALRSCLHAPIDWAGTYFGDGARRTAAEVLLKLGELTPDGLLDSLLPILSARESESDLERTIGILAGVEECRKQALEAVRNAMQGVQRIHRGNWRVVQQIFRLGLPDVERVHLLLGVLAEEGHYQDEVDGELRSLFGLASAQPGGEADTPSDGDSQTNKRKRFQLSRIRGAAVLADLPKWPALLLDSLAEMVPCSIDSLRSLEEEGRSMDQTKVVALLESLLYHQAGDGSVARLVRYASLLRFGPLVGILPEQLPYELTR